MKLYAIDGFSHVSFVKFVQIFLSIYIAFSGEVGRSPATRRLTEEYNIGLSCFDLLRLTGRAPMSHARGADVNKWIVWANATLDPICFKDNMG